MNVQISVTHRNRSSSVIDLSKVKKLIRYLGYPRHIISIRYDQLIDLLQQTPNLHSLTLDPSGSILLVRQPIEDVYSVIIHYVDRSKLRHLDIFVINIHQVQTLLERFINLCAVRFRFQSELISSEEISDYLMTLMPDCSIWQDSYSVSIWMDQRVKTTDTCRRLERPRSSRTGRKRVRNVQHERVAIK